VPCCFVEALRHIKIKKFIDKVKDFNLGNYLVAMIDGIPEDMKINGF